MLRPVHYELPDGVDPAALTSWLGERRRLSLTGTRRGPVRTVLDTADGRLWRAGLVATVARTGGAPALLEVDGPDGPVGPAVPARSARPPKVLAADLGDGHLGAALAEVVENRALLPRARFRTTAETFAVLNRDDKTVVRGALLRTEVLDERGRGVAALRPRLEVVPVRGYHGAHARLLELVHDDLDLRPAERTLVDEVLLAAGVDPAGSSTDTEVALDPGEPAAPAIARVLLRLAVILAEQVEGTIDDLDPEFLHDLRVATRRSRSLLRELRTAIPEDLGSWARTELKWVQSATGPLRDLDVALEDLPALAARLPDGVSPADLDPVRRLVEQRRASALRDVRRALRSERFATLLERWQAELAALSATPDPHSLADDAGRPLAAVVGRRIRRVYADLCRRGEALGEESPAEDLHDLRKRGKELRYLLELFGVLYPSEVVKPLVKALKGLQDSLGRHQDHEVQAAELRDLAPDLAVAPGGPAALMALGLVADRLLADQRSARAEVADRMARFGDPELAASVDAAFRRRDRREDS